MFIFSSALTCNAVQLEWRYPQAVAFVARTAGHRHSLYGHVIARPLRYRDAFAPAQQEARAQEHVLLCGRRVRQRQQEGPAAQLHVLQASALQRRRTTSGGFSLGSAGLRLRACASICTAWAYLTRPSIPPRGYAATPLPAPVPQSRCTCTTMGALGGACYLARTTTLATTRPACSAWRLLVAAGASVASWPPCTAAFPSWPRICCTRHSSRKWTGAGGRGQGMCWQRTGVLGVDPGISSLSGAAAARLVPPVWE